MKAKAGKLKSDIMGTGPSLMTSLVKEMVKNSDFSDSSSNNQDSIND